MLRILGFCILLGVMASAALVAGQERAAAPAWTRAADEKPPMTVPETRAFMKRLAQYVVAHHLKRAPDSPQRGMIYEYCWVEKQGALQQWIQGEALDTMHDGAWFACAMVNAWRATGDPYYKEVLTRWQLPFYLKMLNRGDELFSSERDDSRPQAAAIWTGNPEHRLQGREKGFVPYWWDDGASVSLERLGQKESRPLFPARDELAGQPNPDYRLSGYSFGSSNHKAQDLAAMLLLAWRMLHDSDEAADRELAAQVAEAAQNLQGCRARHGSPGIPIVLAACGLTAGDAAALRRTPEDSWKSVLVQKSHYQRAAIDFQPGQRYATPGFADDQQYRYYTSIARAGTLTEPVAWRTVYDAFTEPKLYNAYCDDAPRPPGINRFDLYPLYFVDGRPEHLRSQRKGPFQGPVPIGSRMGPQNMICCGWALQALAEYPNLWEAGLSQGDAKALGLADADGRAVTQAEVAAWLTRELGGGLRTWEAIFDHYGYVPTGIGCQTALPGVRWDAFSDTGGYAHLISAAAQWLLVQQDERDWEGHMAPEGERVLHPPRRSEGM